uniref:phosphoacetylglucosamine mutase n=1 Tax=Romanomermis culicivorax TaxID=13658 RepID=A0A915JAT1_ROMCU
MKPIIFRMGILAAIRSISKRGKAIGIMITASHNPIGENGIKLIDPQGEMLESAWERHATKLVNTTDQNLHSDIEDLMSLLKLNLDTVATVYCARDNRPSGEMLIMAARNGVSQIKNAVFFDFGVLTTPQLHFIVKRSNTTQAKDVVSVEDYYREFARSFILLSKQISEKTSNSNYDRNIYLDASNGVGGPNFEALVGRFEAGLLSCGADFVKVERKVPTIYTPDVRINSSQKWASFDGDADRLVYYFIDQNNRFHLLDGDKIAILFATFFGELLEKVDLGGMEIGIVQTAYANGNSTSYIKNNFKNIRTYFVSTGVKHLHKQAEMLDVGIYFEANGHGTVVFSQNFKDTLEKYVDGSSHASSEKLYYASLLSSFVNLINETVGDAFTDLLVVESILKYKDWSIAQWNSLYTDLPSKQLKVKVADRNLIETADAERICISPIGLQEAINATISKYSQARAFVRPSGTEDVVRVYAEADTEGIVKMNGLELALKMKNLKADNAALLICDMQEKFRNVIPDFKSITTTCQRAIKCAQVLGIPCIVAELYPEKLGSTIEELELSKFDAIVLSKESHSMRDAVLDQLKASNIKSILLCGIASHVCIFQSCVDFLLDGFDVFILADACSASTAQHK